MVLETATSNTAILPVQEALSADARTYNELLHRWIEVKMNRLHNTWESPVRNDDPDPMCRRRTYVLGGLIHEYRLVAWIGRTGIQHPRL